ncbi:hypothetical protein Hamer_G028176, partial [Homarus americanus]
TWARRVTGVSESWAGGGVGPGLRVVVRTLGTAGVMVSQRPWAGTLGTADPWARRVWVSVGTLGTTGSGVGTHRHGSGESQARLAGEGGVGTLGFDGWSESDPQAGGREVVRPWTVDLTAQTQHYNKTYDSPDYKVLYRTLTELLQDSYRTLFTGLYGYSPMTSPRLYLTPRMDLSVVVSPGARHILTGLSQPSSDLGVWGDWMEASRAPTPIKTRRLALKFCRRSNSSFSIKFKSSVDGRELVSN